MSDILATITMWATDARLKNGSACTQSEKNNCLALNNCHTNTAMYSTCDDTYDTCRKVIAEIKENDK